MKVKPVCDHELYFVLLGYVDHRFAITFARSHGFFAKNMATTTSGTFSMFPVKRIRSGNINGIDFFAVDCGFQIIVRVNVHAVAAL